MENRKDGKKLQTEQDQNNTNHDKWKPFQPLTDM